MGCGSIDDYIFLIRSSRLWLNFRIEIVTPLAPHWIYRRRVSSLKKPIPNKEHQALKPVFVVAKPCNYIIMWCTGDFSLNADIVKGICKMVIKASQPPLNDKIKFGESRRAAQLHIIPIQVSQVLNQKFGVSLEYTCSMAPQLDSHHHRSSVILWETLQSGILLEQLTFSCVIK